RRGGGGDEAVGQALDRLMMPAVDDARVGVAQALSHQPLQNRSLFNPQVMREVERLEFGHLEAVRERARDLGRNVLHERSAESDVHGLDTSADPEDREAALPGLLSELNLEGIARRSDLAQRRDRLLAIVLRPDVFAAAQKDAADSVEGRS